MQTILDPPSAPGLGYCNVPVPCPLSSKAPCSSSTSTTLPRRSSSTAFASCWEPVRWSASSKHAARLAATKVGVPDYKSLVNQKLHIADELYRSLVEEYQTSRGFLLEVLVVIILLIELAALFRGK